MIYWHVMLHDNSFVQSVDTSVYTQDFWLFFQFFILVIFIVFTIHTHKFFLFKKFFCKEETKKTLSWLSFSCGSFFPLWSFCVMCDVNMTFFWSESECELNAKTNKIIFYTDNELTYDMAAAWHMKHHYYCCYVKMMIFCLFCC